MVDRIRYPTVSYLPFYYVFFQFLLLTIFNLQANILTTKDILSNLVYGQVDMRRPYNIITALGEDNGADMLRLDPMSQMLKAE